MSMEAVFFNLLSTNAAVVAEVGNKIYPSRVPLGVVLPALSYEIVSRVERTTVSSMESTVLVTYRVQVDSHARDYDQLLRILKAVRAALANKRGDIAGAKNVTIRPEFHSIDTFNEDIDIYSRSSDFLATLSEQVS